MPSIIQEKTIRHPNTFSIVTGHTLLSEEIKSINQSIKLILTTAPGELWGDPNFGSYLYEYLFEYTGPVLDTLIKSEIVRALSIWEPRIYIQESDITMVTEGVTVKINVDYKIKYTNYRGTYEYLTMIYKEEQ